LPLFILEKQKEIERAVRPRSEAVAGRPSRHEITIPRDVRLRLGLKRGDVVEFLVERDYTVIRPARREGEVFRRYAGAVQTFPEGAPEIQTWVAQLRDAE